MTPTQMKAVVLTPHGQALQDVKTLAPEPDEVLIQVKAASLNRADLLSVKRGVDQHNAERLKSHPGMPSILGNECAGIVAEVGAAVIAIKVGDRVMGTAFASHAEYAIASPGNLHIIPEGMTYQDAACLPVALVAMHDAIVTAGRLNAGDSVLIQGASSAVGLIGLQVARQMGAGAVFGTSTTAEKRAQLGRYGADYAIDSSEPTWPEDVVAKTGGVGVNLIIDQIAGKTVLGSLHAAAQGARFVNVGRLGGERGEFDFESHAFKRISYIGVTFRTRPADEAQAAIRRMWDDLAPAVADGNLTLPIDRAFSLNDADAAYRYMDSNHYFGKIVLTMGG
ncbi:quinone oxidoreductase family protein [Williamsia maris]|uniref:NADPH2:quinone reductase n=1 Tax=Williamsia maris TaxID=72806 RepID=A0ABT1HJI0_9NOCA|nr:zinc-binding dehydrogenase [Williamsia maris]MCP2178090.1 NADPH2:quinone reductase [Williamsia maris]